jgi:hypothetical protein
VAKEVGFKEKSLKDFLELNKKLEIFYKFKKELGSGK